MKNRRCCVFFCSLLAAATAFCADTGIWTMDIVDELAALSTQANPTNTWTGTQGGTWKLLNGTADVPYAKGGYSKDATGFLTGFKSSSSYFTFLANTNASGKVTGPWDGGVNPGAVYFHPASATLVKLRYIPVQSGTYAVSCTLGVAGYNGGDGVAATLLLDGVALACATTHTAALSFDVPNLQVWSGQQLELSLSSLTGISNDATSLKYAISRTGDVTNRLFSTTFEEVVRRAYASGSFTPYDGIGGSWTFIHQPKGTGPWVDLSTKYKDSKSTALYGFASVASGQNAYPRFVANTSAGNLRPTDASYDIVPGEVFVHPGDYTPVALRFTAASDGVYSLRVQARNLMDLGRTRLKVLVNNDPVYANLVTNCINGVVRAYTNDTCVLAAGDTMDVVVDPAGNYSYDATGVRFTFALLEDHAGEGLKSYSAVSALRASLKSAEPQALQFTAPDGGVWSFGEYGSGYDPATFTPYASYYPGLRAFLGANPVENSGTYYPYLYANADGVEARVLVHPTFAGSEFAFHPKSNVYGALRFHVPQDGVYSVAGYFKSIDRNSWGNGVDGGIVVNGTFHPRYAIVNAYASSGLPASFSVDTENLWLKQGDVVDFVNGPNGTFNCDATACSYFVLRRGVLPSASHLGIDICGRTRAAQAGAGRVGLATDGTWASVPAGGLRSGRVEVGGAVRDVRLVLDRAASETELTGVPALLSDGVVSANGDDAVAFRVTGLDPEATYTLYLFSRNASREKGVFTIGGETKSANDAWFARNVGDHCAFTAVADANGEISGTFSGTVAGAATFCGLQIVGALPAYVPTGTMVILR